MKPGTNESKSEKHKRIRSASLKMQQHQRTLVLITMSFIISVTIPFLSFVPMSNDEPELNFVMNKNQQSSTASKHSRLPLSFRYAPQNQCPAAARNLSKLCAQKSDKPKVARNQQMEFANGGYQTIPKGSGFFFGLDL